jgi:hypothetical protein
MYLEYRENATMNCWETTFYPSLGWIKMGLGKGRSVEVRPSMMFWRR